jgi:hypothetical protein
VQFNGYNSSIAVNHLSTTIPQTSVTISGWVYISGFTNSNGDQVWWFNEVGNNAIGLQGGANTYPGATSASLTYWLHNASGSYFGCGGTGYLNKWYFVTEVTSGTVATLYVNGAAVCSFSFNNPGTEKVLAIGSYYTRPSGAGGTMDGLLANIQLYNTALSANDIQALYQEGIGGAPIKIQSLVGWWPLNGNANDYSGNANNGQTYNVTFIGNWYSSYTPT